MREISFWAHEMDFPGLFFNSLLIWQWTTNRPKEIRPMLIPLPLTHHTPLNPTKSPKCP